MNKLYMLLWLKASETGVARLEYGGHSNDN